MKIKFKRILIIVTIVLLNSLVFSACSESCTDIPAHDEHVWGDWQTTIEATCTEDGLMERVCSIGGEKETEIIPAKGHQFNEENKCAVCGYELQFTTGLKYEEYEDGYSVTGIGNSTDKEIVIPAQHAGKRVLAIEDNAFSGNDYIESVYIPNGVTHIGEKAFYYCVSLKTVTLPVSLKSMGAQAFYACSGLNRFFIPSGFDCSFGANALTNSGYYNNMSNWSKNGLYLCNILLAVKNGVSGKFEVADGTLSIAQGAFLNKSELTEIIIPESVTSISEGELSGCSSLQKLTLPFVGNSADVNSSSDIQYPFGYIFGTANYSGAQAIQQENYIYERGKDTSYYNKTYYIPASLKTVTVNGNNDKNIYILNKAFKNCNNIEELTLNVSYIESGAFENCSSIKTLVIGDKVEISEGLLSGFSSLENLTLSKAGRYYYPLGYVFGTTEYTGGTKTKQKYSRYDNVNIDYDNTTIVYYYIPSTLKTVTVTGTSVAAYAFWGLDNLTNIYLGNDVRYIGRGAFACDNLKYNEYNNGLYLGNKENPYLALIKVKDRAVTAFKINDKAKIIAPYVFSGMKDLKSVEIGKSVERINETAFGSCEGLKNITIPDSVKIIGYEAFRGCSGLTSITIPNGVTSIGYDAFSGCSDLTTVYWNATECETAGSSTHYIFSGCSSLNKVILGGNVTNIPAYAFSGCSGLTSITIPNSVTSIGYEAFDGCSGLTSVTIPNSVTSIGSSAFENCSGLTSITVESGNAKYHSSGNCLIETESKTLILGCKNSVIPCDGSVTSIGHYAFDNCSSLTSVTIPDSVTSIGYGAFRGCSSLTSVTIPNSVTSIGSAAFRGCSSLQDITLPFIGEKADVTQSTVYPLGYIFGTSPYTGGTGTPQAYYHVNGSTGYGTTYYIPNSLRSVTVTGGNILVGAFEYCSGLTSITIGNGVTSIGVGAFYNCSGLTSVTIPNSVTSIGGSAFSGCSGLTSITVESGNAKYHSSGNCLIETESKTLILGCKNSVIPSDGSVTSIGDYAFRGCSSLTSVTIPNSVTSIGHYAFEYCYKLIEVCNDSALDIKARSSDHGYVGFYAKNVYSSASGQSKLSTVDDCVIYTDGEDKILIAYVGNKTDVILPESITQINQYAFYNCSSLTSVTIPDGVTSISNRAFYNCSGLTSITIPNSVTSIGGYAFYNCSSLTSITIPDSVTSIGDSAFEHCYKLVEVCNDSALEIKADSRAHGYVGYYAKNVYSSASGQSKLSTVDDCVIYTDGEDKILIAYVGNKTDVILPESITQINQYAFYNCSSLTSVTIGNSVTSIGYDAFYNCSSLTSVTIGNSVTSIGNYAFSGCSSLTSVTIGNSVTSIGNYAFSSCSSLTSVTFKNTNGWFVTQYYGATTGTNVNVTGATENATYLRSTYNNYFWKRS